MRLAHTIRRPARTGPAVITILLPVLGLLAATVLGLLATAHAAPPRHDRTAPVLDPDDPHGAWAGYSIGDRPGQPLSIPDGGVSGMDVSGHQGEVDWAQAWDDGARFAYVKATEGTTYRNEVFDQQYHGSADAGMIRGSYHFALPDASSGAEQARFFVQHGGAWSPDGRTLPGALDIESNPYGDQCYGLSPADMSAWVAEFSDTYQKETGRPPAIYTSASWWNECTGGATGFSANPLWVARHGPEIGELPAGWQTHTIWQYNDHGTFPGDQNTFNGDGEQLAAFAG